MRICLLRQKVDYVAFCQRLHSFTIAVVNKFAIVIMLIIGLALLSGGLTELSLAQLDPTGRLGDSTVAGYDADDVRGSVELLFQLVEGAFGALIMVVAGLGAIVSAAFGAYRSAVAMMVVAVGAFILRALVSLFFGEFDDNDITRALTQNKGQPIAGVGDIDDFDGKGGGRR